MLIFQWAYYFQYHHRPPHVCTPFVRLFSKRVRWILLLLFGFFYHHGTINHTRSIYTDSNVNENATKQITHSKLNEEKKMMIIMTDRIVIDTEKKRAKRTNEWKRERRRKHNREIEWAKKKRNCMLDAFQYRFFLFNALSLCVWQSS